MLIVIALGGNALLRRGEPLTAERQRANVKRAAAAMAEVIGAGHRVVVCHGNGPQVGLLALQSEAYKPEEAYPLDVLGAQTEGMIGYIIEQELENALAGRKRVATLLTQVEVDADDPAFRKPTKPIGPVYSRTKAEKLARQRGWSIAADGTGHRRVVASPPPKHIPDVSVIRLLVEQDVIVICGGGGGIPVIRRSDGSLIGIEAVIDKDRVAALLAEELGADMLLMLTDVDAVYRNWGSSSKEPIRTMSVDQIRPEEFPAGSMGPKIQAARDFVAATGGTAGIGALGDAIGIIEGRYGTLISSGDPTDIPPVPKFKTTEDKT